MKLTYLIQAVGGGPVKIGVASDPLARVKSLQTGRPEELRVVALLDGPDYEVVLHQRYADRRLRGEWFEPSVLDDILADPPAPLYEYRQPNSCRKCSHCGDDYEVFPGALNLDIPLCVWCEVMVEDEFGLSPSQYQVAA